MFVRHELPSGLMPLGPQGLPNVFRDSPPLNTQPLSKACEASFHLHLTLDSSPTVWRATPRMSTSTYWLKLPRRTVRPSWVASQAIENPGASVKVSSSRSPRLFSPVAQMCDSEGV